MYRQNPPRVSGHQICFERQERNKILFNCTVLFYDASSNVELRWASKEIYHVFRAMLTKIHLIKINHVNHRVAFVKKEKMWWITKSKFSKKITEINCSLRTFRKGHLFRTFNSYSISMAGFVTIVLAFVCACEVSSLHDIKKITLCNFTALYRKSTSIRHFEQCNQQLSNLIC